MIKLILNKYQQFVNTDSTKKDLVKKKKLIIIHYRLKFR